MLIAGPSSLLTSATSSEDRPCLLLPHPRTSLPAYFILDDDGEAIYELQGLKGEKKIRSWFLYGSGESGESTGNEAGKGWVIEDGTLQMVSRIDPLFLLLALFDPPDDAASTSYLPPDDLFESAAARHYTRRAQAYNASLPKEGTDARVEESGGNSNSTWDDIVAFGSSRAGRAALDRCSDTQDLDSTGEALAYRLSEGKVLHSLRAKLKALATPACFETHSSLLGRPLARQTEIDASSAELATARIRIAADAIRNYIPAASASGSTRSWEDVFDAVVRAEHESTASHT
ncbi:unnamed protein product [Parajaminaea phylloscopi]